MLPCPLASRVWLLNTLLLLLCPLQLVAGGMFLVMMLRPFLKHISNESRRCVELLAQLPPDMDVEGMVASTWSVVKQVRHACRNHDWHSAILVSIRLGQTVGRPW
jgi:hypothetical protein